MNENILGFVTIPNMKTFPTLYKRAVTGAIQQWTISVEGNQFWTEAGQVGGVITKSLPTTCEAKNIGRANATTDEEQALAEASSKHQHKLDRNYVLDIKEVDKTPSYFSPMLAHQFEDRKDKINWDNPCFIQPKLDGIRAIITANGATTRNGKEHKAIPHILKALEPLFKKNPTLIFDGEVYNHVFHDDFNHITSIVRKTKPTFEDLLESAEYAQYHIYDFPVVADYDQEDKFSDRFNAGLELITPIASNNTCIQIVPTYPIFNEAEVYRNHDTFVSNGYEGAIVRIDGFYENKRSNNLLKYKQSIDDEFTIESILEGTGNKANMAATIGIHTKDGVWCEPNIKAPHDVLKNMWLNKDKYIGKICTVRYFGLTPDKSLRFPRMVDIDRWTYE